MPRDMCVTHLERVQSIADVLPDSDAHHGILEDCSTASFYTDHGRYQALSCPHVRAARGTDSRIIEPLRLMHDESMIEQDTFAFVCRLRQRRRQGHHPDGLDEGRTAGRSSREMFIDMARISIASSLIAQRLQEASGSKIREPS